MTLDQQIQMWNTIGTWVAGIGTLAAVIVSLWLARRGETARQTGIEQSRGAVKIAGHEVREQVPEVQIANGIQVAVSQGTYVTCSILNEGRALVSHCQAVVSAVAKWDNGGWSPTRAWLPLGLLWCLDDSNIRAGTPTLERQLVPNRPYLFDLVAVSSSNPTLMHLRVTLHPTGQPTQLASGKYCFGVSGEVD